MSILPIDLAAVEAVRQYIPGIFRVETNIDRAWALWIGIGPYVTRETFRIEARRYKEIADWGDIVPTLGDDYFLPRDSIMDRGWEGMTTAYQTKVALAITDPLTGELTYEYRSVAYNAPLTVGELKALAAEAFEVSKPITEGEEGEAYIAETIHKAGAAW